MMMTKRKRKKRKKDKKKKNVKSKLELQIKEEINFDALEWVSVVVANKNKKNDDKFETKIEKLKDITGYAIRIKAKNGSGYGAPCSSLTFLTPQLLVPSKILKDKEKAWLITKILDSKLRKKKLKLLFRASRDGFSAYLFHQKCDNKGATIVIAESTLKHVFGGYSKIPWNGNLNNYNNDPDAFLFLLRSPRGGAPDKWKSQSGNSATYNLMNYGPTYGSGHDLYLCDNCNSSTTSYSNFGHSYASPKDNAMLTGAYNFMVKDYEVFQIV